MSTKEHGIEWLNRPGTAPETWNPIVGCSVVSPGCTNCYAMAQAARIERMGGPIRYEGLTQPSNGGPVWTGVMRYAPDSVLLKPLSWKKPRTIFVNSMSDLFAEQVPDTWIDRVFAIMALCPQHTFIVLTKRAARMRRYVTSGASSPLSIDRLCYMATEMELLLEDSDDAVFKILTSQWPLPNVWLGVSTERQKEADARIPDLIATPAAVRFISAEPLLGPVKLWEVDEEAQALRGIGIIRSGGVTPSTPDGPAEGFDDSYPGIDWVIVGGESSPNARPMHPDWVRSLRTQCFVAGVPFFFKQWGNWVPELDRDVEDPDWRADYQRFERNGFRILNLAGGIGFHGERVHVMRPSSKASAGRTLDGREHLEWPTTEPAEPKIEEVA